MQEVNHGNHSRYDMISRSLFFSNYCTVFKKSMSSLNGIMHLHRPDKIFNFLQVKFV